MASKQQEYYNQLKTETEGKVAIYNEFGKQIEQIKKDSTNRVKSLNADRKAIAGQIVLNNKLLKNNGQPVVVFEKPKK